MLVPSIIISLLLSSLMAKLLTLESHLISMLSLQILEVIVRGVEPRLFLFMEGFAGWQVSFFVLLYLLHRSELTKDEVTTIGICSIMVLRLRAMTQLFMSEVSSLSLLILQTFLFSSRQRNPEIIPNFSLLQRQRLLISTE